MHGRARARALWSTPRVSQQHPGSGSSSGSSTSSGANPTKAAGARADEGQQRQQAGGGQAERGAAGGGSAGAAAAAPAPPAAPAGHSPLQSLMDVAGGGGAGGQLPGGSVRPRGAVLPSAPRSWVWYDAEDEREEQQRERAGRAERYALAGFAHRVNADQSVKKMNRVLSLVRGLPYAEAVHQCRLQPRKAARMVLECLEHAREDAVGKGLSTKKLVVGTIYATKGQFEKGVRPMGRGNMGRQFARRSHVTVALREDRDSGAVAGGHAQTGGAGARGALYRAVVGPVGRGRRAPRGTAFGARIVAPAMAAPPRARARFQYATEV
ncbi:hypothetical protein FOA52_006845 [Chlamydomonas sp. UWO 241]|nr:hypothetical protein FOA52_006845 [Chlamydomonas sp. UWO 241]